jgi:hypothetical protein
MTTNRVIAAPGYRICAEDGCEKPVALSSRHHKCKAHRPSGNARRPVPMATPAAKASLPPGTVRRHLKPITPKGCLFSAFSEAAEAQRDRDIPEGHRSRWSDEQNKWIDDGPWTSPLSAAK